MQVSNIYKSNKEKLRILHESRHMFMYTELTEKEVVKILNTTPRDLREIYKTFVSLTPKAYITKVKMSKAKTLLRTTSSSIIEIACYLGYENPSHMSAKFKEFYDITPSSYRRINLSLAS